MDPFAADAKGLTAGRQDTDVLATLEDGRHALRGAMHDVLTVV